MHERKVDRETLARLSREVAPREAGLRGLLRSLHRRPPLREWVTMESVALVPVPERTTAGWTLTSLLAVPDGAGGHQPAWAAVRWSWPSERVLAMTDLRDAGHAGPAGASGWTAPSSDDVDDLLRRLEAGLAGERFDPAALAPLYSRVLPPAARERYAELVPSVRDWLAASPAGEGATTATPTSKREAAPQGPLPWLAGLLAEAEQLARAHGVAAVEEQLSALRRRRLLPGFRVAVVGESNRGKSLLVNTLLGARVLPSSATSPALPPVAVVAGRPHLEIAWRDGRRTERPLDGASWDDLALAGSQAGDVLAIRCFVDSGWLRELDAELVDTPAINESPDRMTLVQQTLDACDAVVLVVSAVSPLSLTERAFLEREVLARHIGRVALVASHMHALAAQDREPVLAFVAARAAELSPELHVGVLDPSDLEPMRALVAALADRSDRASWRDRQHAQQLLDAVDALAEAGREGVAAASLNERQRRAAIEAAKQETERRKLSWERTRIELDRRRIALAGRLRSQLAATRDAVVDGLMREAERAPNAAKWWDRELPWRLERELTAAAGNLDKTLVAGLEADLAWLDAKLEAGGHQPRARDELDTARAVQAPTIETHGLRDLDRWKLFSRAGGGLVTIMGALVYPPAGIALGITAAVAGELHLGEAGAEQRERVRAQLAGTVDAAMRAHGDAIQDRLADFYAKLLDDFAVKQAAWERARLAALTAPAGAGGPDWTRLVERAGELRGRIAAALGSQDDDDEDDE